MQSHPGLTAVLLVAYLLWGAVVWRARGGAFHALTGINIGTQATRLAAGLLMAAPLAFWHPWALLFAPALFVGLLCVGWGPYMGLGHSTPDRAQGVVDPILHYGFGDRETFWSDWCGLALCGLILMVWSVPIAAVWHPVTIACVLGAGALLPVAYWAAYRLCLPTLGPLVDDRTVWGECGAGILVAAALWAVCS